MSLSLEHALERFWGYTNFRPLQQEAMSCVMNGHDSLVVLPTGGGKSLCFQVPAMCLPGMAIVVSPLIALMKDQVDTLRQNGIPAAFINSTLDVEERRQVARWIHSGELKLLYIAPERLVLPGTLEFLGSAQVSMIAVDEAHCISEWGHDFRPEYRGLSVVRERFPDVAVHAYTATATPRVRDDIAAQLGLREPTTLVGSFDRPNLVYRVERRDRLNDQVLEVATKHPGEAGIVYCPTRNQVEEMAALLKARGIKALPYHAGLADNIRRKHQDAFLNESVDVITATVAFGMGIDKSNVRYVVHAAMPKSLEAYQQESGRAGRDGLPAECWLFYSTADLMRWRNMIDGDDEVANQVARDSLDQVAQFCTSAACRHQSLVRHFGQELPHQSCDACDVCLGDVDLLPDALVVAQKILSSVVRQKERFGGEYTALVLKGSKDQRVLQNGHDELSTYGILSQHDTRVIRDWVEQLVGQGFLEKTGEFNVLQVTPLGWQVLRGELAPKLLQPANPKTSKARKSKSVDEAAWEGVDHELFESLRQLRREVATQMKVPPYIIFSDASLRDMARLRPTTMAHMHLVKGVGAKKADDFGELFLERILEHLAEAK
ncbi:MAG: DNA helicase RecQ [Planctomycetales bacterium]|nr:DNA helicase RecQ [Planctomycetales bacterium]